MNTLEDKINQMNSLVELHLHLDGALSIKNCRELAKMQDISIPDDDETMREIMVVPENCHNLNEFLTKFEFPLSLLQTKEGITIAVKNLADELINQGIIYAEIRFAPQLSTNKGLTQEQVVKAAIEGTKQTKLYCNLICCCMRGDNNNEQNMETVRIAQKYLNKGICAIDLAGAEGIYPTKNFEELFKYAKKLEVPFTIHAGEADGPESVKEAIRFGAKRIGHGVRASEDMDLIDVLAKERITLEICPTSNICTSIYEKISNLPILKFINKGINVTINTDDPTVCDTTLKNELKLLADSFNLSYNDLVQLQLNAINASFASEDIKNEVINIVTSDKTIL